MRGSGDEGKGEIKISGNSIDCSYVLLHIITGRRYTTQSIA